MLLNEPTMVARSGSSVGGSRVCRPPAPIRAAAVGDVVERLHQRAGRPDAERRAGQGREDRERGEHRGQGASVDRSSVVDTTS